ncbi:MAG: SMI1/KNR4 family protein, partial [Deltaproteobacteria bacterium]|nr:SMI1/KNR4 family protein [Deltaproteobacteria bacterium]
VKPVYWSSTGWLPLASGDDGDGFFVDLAPTHEGVVGQVFVWYKADGAARVVASSVETWLALQADCMESGTMSIDAEYGLCHEDD